MFACDVTVCYSTSGWAEPATAVKVARLNRLGGPCHYRSRTPCPTWNSLLGIGGTFFRAVLLVSYCLTKTVTWGKIVRWVRFAHQMNWR